MATVDLHIHSIISGDADYTVEQLLEFALRADLQTIAITDHNKIGSVNEAIRVFTPHGIKVIPGIEIDCSFKGLNIHVLGYQIDVSDPIFEQFGRDYHEQDKIVTWQMVDKLAEIFGIEFDYALLRDHAKDGVIIPEDVAEIIIHDSRYRHMNWLKPYLPGGLRADNPYVNFYWDMMAQDRVAHVGMNLPDVNDVIDHIHRTGGIAVIAHPGNNFKSKWDLFVELLDQTNLDGIEVCSSYHSEAQTMQFYEEAKKRKLLMTCGSDFHGKNKPSIKMGGISFYGLSETEFYR